MRKQYDDFTQLKLKDMSKSISDMTYKYINPETNAPTKVPPAHYEKILDQVTEKYMADVTSRQFLTIMYNQLNLLKKEDERYFREALICLDMGLNPKDMRIEEQVALNYASDFVVERQAELKKDFHFLSEEIVDAYRYGKEDRFIQSTAIKESNDIESNDIEGLNQKNKDSWER